jgi:hypothetical protein
MDEEYGLNRMGENDDDDAEGNSTAPPTPTPRVAMPEEIVEEEAPVEMVPEQEAPMVHEEILADAKPELPHPTSST